MILEIVTPEAVLYKGTVSIITLPGAKGSFQILENHAPIVALLDEGTITFSESEAPKVFAQEYFLEQTQAKGERMLSITGGVVEQKDNKIVRYKVFSLQILVGMLKFDYYLLCKIQGAIYGDMLK